MQRNEEMPKRRPEMGGERPAGAAKEKTAMAEIEELQQRAAELGKQLAGDLAGDLSTDRKLDTQAKEKIRSLAEKEKAAEGTFTKLLRWASEKLKKTPKQETKTVQKTEKNFDELEEGDKFLRVMEKASITPENIKEYVANQGDKIIPAKEIKPLTAAEREGLVQDYAAATAEYNAAELEAIRNPSPDNEARLRALKDKKADIFGKMNEVPEELDIEWGERQTPASYHESAPVLHAALEKVRSTELQQKKEATIGKNSENIDERIVENTYKLSDAFKQGEHPVSFLQERRRKLEEFIQNSSTPEGQADSENARALKKIQSEINDLELKMANASGMERFGLFEKKGVLDDQRYELQQKIVAASEGAKANIAKARRQQEQIDEIISALNSGDELPAQAYLKKELDTINEAKKQMAEPEEMSAYGEKLKRIIDNASTATELIILREASAKPKAAEVHSGTPTETTRRNDQETDALEQELMETKAKIIALEARISQLTKKKREKKGTPDIKVIGDLDKSKKEMYQLLNKQSELEETIEEKSAGSQKLAA